MHEGMRGAQRDTGWAVPVGLHSSVQWEPLPVAFQELGGALCFPHSHLMVLDAGKPGSEFPENQSEQPFPGLSSQNNTNVKQPRFTPVIHSFQRGKKIKHPVCNPGTDLLRDGRVLQLQGLGPSVFPSQVRPIGLSELKGSTPFRCVGFLLRLSCRSIQH